jgi:hypothetical protein
MQKILASFLIERSILIYITHLILTLYDMESHSPAPALRQNQISSERKEGQVACELCPRVKWT